MTKAFTADDRAAAVARVAAGERPTAVARDVGVAVESLRRWRVALGQEISRVGRAPNGQVLPGFTPNPGGSTVHVERTQRMLEEASPKTAQRLIELTELIMNESDPDKLALLEVKGRVLHKLWGQILDRGIGKATQRVEVKGDTAPPEIIVDLTPEKS
jgi:hypothetical protein